MHACCDETKRGEQVEPRWACRLSKPTSGFSTRCCCHFRTPKLKNGTAGAGGFGDCLQLTIAQLSHACRTMRGTSYLLEEVCVV